MISLKDASIKFALSSSHLRLLCRKKLLPAQKIGRDWLLIESEKEIRQALDEMPKRGKYTRRANPIPN